MATEPRGPGIGHCGRHLLAALCLVLGLGADAAVAAPVAEDQRVPLDLRRTTLIVSDMERSLRLYRDAIGMQVIYDKTLLRPADAPSAEQAERVSRLVFLRANDDYIGVPGLLQYLKPNKDRVDLAGRAFDEGTTVLVINHAGAEAAFQRALALEGVTELWAPAETSYPSYDGTSQLRVVTSGLQDPDGFVVELNRLIDAPDLPGD